MRPKLILLQQSTQPYNVLLCLIFYNKISNYQLVILKNAFTSSCGSFVINLPFAFGPRHHNGSTASARKRRLKYDDFLISVCAHCDAVALASLWRRGSFLSPHRRSSPEDYCFFWPYWSETCMKRPAEREARLWGKVIRAWVLDMLHGWLASRQVRWWSRLVSSKVYQRLSRCSKDTSPVSMLPPSARSQYFIYIPQLRFHFGKQWFVLSYIFI